MAPRGQGKQAIHTPERHKFNDKKDNKTDISVHEFSPNKIKIEECSKTQIKSIFNPLREKCDVPKNKKFETKEEKKR